MEEDRLWSGKKYHLEYRVNALANLRRRTTETVPIEVTVSDDYYLGREVSERALKTRMKKQFRDDRKHYSVLKDEEEISKSKERDGGDELHHNHGEDDGSSELHGLRHHVGVGSGGADRVSPGVVEAEDRGGDGGVPSIDSPQGRGEREGSAQIESRGVVDGEGGREEEEEEGDEGDGDGEDAIVGGEAGVDEGGDGVGDDDAQQGERFMPYVVFLRSRYRENPSPRDVILRKICYVSLVIDLAVSSIGIFGAASSTWLMALCILALIGDGCGIYGVRMSSNKMLTACLVTLMTVILSISVQKVMLFDLLCVGIALLTSGCIYILRSRLMAQIFITTYQGDQPPN
eukprot:TRINITY_DN2838_c0_g1_i2.p1 TRINITY_DN2838_c0_g1~~TRINITY_DN2838_c0_g1_i2.p1  ORF type:complete len:345 (-),score=126.02 TRINITY_DN2838_c0_g1_i2:1097-2131(-)